MLEKAILKLFEKLEKQELFHVSRVISRAEEEAMCLCRFYLDENGSDGPLSGACDAALCAAPGKKRQEFLIHLLAKMGMEE